MRTKHIESRGFDPILTGMLVAPVVALGLASYVAARDEAREPVAIEYRTSVEEIYNTPRISTEEEK